MTTAVVIAAAPSGLHAEGEGGEADAGASGSNGGSASVGVLTGRVSVVATPPGVDLGRRDGAAFLPRAPVSGLVRRFG